MKPESPPPALCHRLKCGSETQWSECSHGMREIQTSSAGGLCTFSSPMTIDGSVSVRAPGASSKAKGFSCRFRHGSEQIWGQSNNSNEAGGNCRRPTVRLCNSMVRVLPRYVRGPEFESRPCHVLFPPLFFLSYILYMYCYTISRGL